MNKIQKSKSAEVGKLITEGMIAWVKAGEIIVELTEDGVPMDTLSKQTNIPMKTLHAFESLGRKTMLPELLVAQYPSAKHLKLLSYSNQKEVINASVDYVTEKGDVVRIPSKDLTSGQCNQVFTGGIVRTIDQQKNYILDRKQEAAITATPKNIDPYRIADGEVIFTRGCRLSKSQLENLLSAC